MPTDCLLGLIGLSAAGATCFPLPTTGDTAYITASATGLYLDTVEGLILRPAEGQNGASDLYQKLDKARLLATQAVRQALLQRGRGAFGANRFAGRSGTLAQRGNGELLSVGTPARLTLTPKENANGAWLLDELRLYTDSVVADVAVLLDGQAVGTLTTNGGAFVATGPLLIPLDGEAHTLEAVLPDGVRVQASTVLCGTCSEWGRYVRSALLNVNTARIPANGFAFQVTEVCTEPLDVLCYATAKNAEVAQSIGFAILYTAAEYFCASLLTDANRSRYTMIEPQALPELRTFYEGKAEKHLAWLVQEDGLGSVKHPCYVCSAPDWQGKKVFVR